MDGHGGRPLLEIDDLHVAVDGTEILRGAQPHGRAPARSTPSWARTAPASRRSPTPCSPTPPTQVTAGAIRFKGEDVTALATDERAARGMFLGFQHPEEIPGVSVLNFLRQAMAARKGIADLSVLEVRMALIEWTKRLGMDDRFTERYLNEGFSGGEKKRNEILQMAMMEPDVAVLDETDSGLDIDALRVVADGIARGAQRPARARHPADHALPADPRAPHPRRRAHPARRPHRRSPAVPSSPSASSARASTRSGRGGVT